MENVECFITIVTGAPGHGKSKRTKEELDLYVMTDPKTGRKGRKVLIFDTNNEYGSVQNVKYNPEDKKDNGIYLSQLVNIEQRRISPFVPPHGKPMTFTQKEKTLVDIMMNYRNGCILLEDINTYMIGGKSVDTISFLCNNRHRGIDIIIHLQSLSAVETRMWQNCRIVRFHFQTDDIHRYRERVPNFELMKIAQNIVNAEYNKGNKYYFLYIDIRANKLLGKITDRQFLDGAMEYIKRYEKQICRTPEMVNKYLEEKSMLYMGKKISSSSQSAKKIDIKSTPQKPQNNASGR